MGDITKTKTQLIDELNALRAKVAALERTKDELRHSTALNESIQQTKIAYEQTTIYAQELKTEVVEHRRTEAALRQSEARLARAQKIARLGNWDWDVAGQTLSWSDEVYRIFGVDREFELTFEGIEAMIHPDDREKNRNFVDDLLATADSSEIELRLVRPDGAVRHIYQNAKIWRDEAGTATRIFGIMQDITERKRVEEALRESEERFRVTFDGAGIGMAILDLNGRLLESNAALQEMLGYTEEELHRLVFTGFTHPEDVAVDWQLAQELFTGKRDRYQMEKRYIRKDGGVVWGRLIGSLVRGTEGEPRFAIGMVEDISERAQAEEALRQYAGRLQQLARQVVSAQEAERKRIALELHDELGQALTAVGFDLAAIEQALPPAVDADVRQKLSGARSLVSELDDRVSTMALDLRPSMLDDLGLVATLRWYVDRYTDRVNVAVELHVNNLEARLTQEIETALYRMVQEALTNVAKHARAGQVSIHLERRDSTVAVSVEDDGRGFETGQISTIPPTSHGIGLLGIQERAASLGGTLTIDSGPGQGTRLEIEIPL